MRSGVFPTAAEVAALSGVELDQALVDLERARRQLEASYLEVIDRADRSRRYADDGHASVRGWVTALANTSGVETQRRLQTMRALRDLPQAAEALSHGSIGVDQVREIAKLHANPRARALIIDAHDTLVDHARKQSFVGFSEVARRWEAFADPSGTESRHETAHNERDAKLFEHNGVIHINAHCGVAQGAALLELFARQCDTEFLAEWELLRAEHGDAASPSLLQRTDAQRRMDALHSIFLAAASTPPGSQAPEPLVNIVMTIEEFEARLIAANGGPNPGAATIDTIDSKHCETTGGIPVSPNDALVATAVGQFRRVVVDSAGVVVNLGRKRRFTGGAKDAVLLWTRRCMWPGCGRNSARNQIDHTYEHSRGGLTAPDNGGPACGRHNRWKSHGYHAHRDNDGCWHVYRPDGTELTRPTAA